MRAFLATSAIALGLTACASQTTTPAQPTATVTPAAATAATPKAAQCWNGDAGKFIDIGVKTAISGVEVVCEKTSDGKSAQWMGKKH